MKVAIYSRGFDLDQRQSLNALLLELHKHDVAICIFHDLLQKFELCAPVGKEAYIPFTSAYDLPENIDCLISLGGDGTVLDSVTLVGDSNIPILFKKVLDAFGDSFVDIVVYIILINKNTYFVSLFLNVLASSFIASSNDTVDTLFNLFNLIVSLYGSIFSNVLNIFLSRSKIVGSFSIVGSINPLEFTDPLTLFEYISERFIHSFQLT